MVVLVSKLFYCESYCELSLGLSFELNIVQQQTYNNTNVVDFNYALCLKVLYCSIMRSGLKYGTVIWNSNQTYLKRFKTEFFVFQSGRFNQIDKIKEVVINIGLKTTKN